MYSSIETQRLVLRKVSEADAPFFLELLNDPTWIEFIGDRKVHTVQDAEKFIRDKYLVSYTENGYGSFLVSEQSSQKPIGLCGLYKRADLEFPDIGFAFLQEYQNKGYGFESAKAVLDHALQDLSLDKILAFTVPTNKASIQLIEKLGLKLNGTYQPAGDDEVLLLFEWIQ